MADSASKEELRAAQEELVEYLEGCRAQLEAKWPCALVAIIAVTGENFSVVATEADDPETVAALFREGEKAVNNCRSAILEKKNEVRRGKQH